MVESKFIAANIRHFYHNWVEIGTNNTVLSWIKEGVTLPFVHEPQPFILQNPELSKREVEFIDSEIKELLNSGAICACKDRPLCVSPVSCVPKKNKSFRLIVDLRKLNSSINCPKFQYEDINTVVKLVQPGDHLITVDIKSGFHHIPVHENFQTFLGIQWKGKFYVWTVVPFGMSASPFFFHKVIRPIIGYLREQGLRLSVYVDDFILAATEDCILRHRDILVTLLKDLGIYVNFEKSSLTPEPVKEHIGYIISTVNDDNNVWIKIPCARLRKVKHDINRLIKRGFGSARAIARVTGQCIAMAKAILPAKLLLRNLYRLLSTRKSWGDILQIDQTSMQDLNWWISAIQNWNDRAIIQQTIDLQVTTDASASGWGGHLLNMEAQGFWNQRLSYQSSNYRELMAVLLTMESFLDVLKGKTIQFLSDNISTVAYINFQGGPSQDLTSIAKAIWTLALQNSIAISAIYLAGRDNIQADRLSRLSVSYEWRLHPRIWQYLDKV